MSQQDQQFILVFATFGFMELEVLCLSSSIPNSLIKTGERLCTPVWGMTK